MGFLDDTWFHRSYWVYGKNFAGGHNGYFQAGKYTTEGRILVHDDKNVYGYSRLPQYYKWTTTMEYQLFAASKEPPDVAVVPAEGGAAGQAIGIQAGGQAADAQAEQERSDNQGGSDRVGAGEQAEQSVPRRLVDQRGCARQKEKSE